MSVLKGALYNEIEPYAAQWMRNLAAAGHIADGTVDERSIADLRRSDVEDHQQVHFFAGIGGWSAALRLADWPDDVPVWTGSCPCQPFSAAGRKGGITDARHLWPEWYRLIRECRPAVVFGEQVAGPDGLKWLDLVSADLEEAGYAVGTANLSAASVGAPHIRQRLYLVAYADGERREGLRVQLRERRPFAPLFQARRSGEAGGLVYTSGEGGGRDSGGVPRAQAEGEGERIRIGDLAYQPVSAGDTYWSGAEYIHCRPEPGFPQGRWRPVEPGTFPLANGVSARMGRLRGYGNAIVRPLAATFIRAVMEILCR